MHRYADFISKQTDPKLFICFVVIAGLLLAVLKQNGYGQEKRFGAILYIWKYKHIEIECLQIHVKKTHKILGNKI